VSIDKFIPTSNLIVMDFPSVEIAHAFKSWMCDGGGEQHMDRICEVEDFGCDYFSVDYHQHPNMIIVSTGEVVD